MRFHVKVVLLLSAYAPAMIIYGFLQNEHSATAAYFVAAMVSFAALAGLMYRTGAQSAFDAFSARKWTLSDPSNREGELAAFLLGYLLPFVQWKDSTGPLAFMALPSLVLLVLFINWRLGFFHLNPSLLLLGWRVIEMVEAESTTGAGRANTRRRVTVLCRKRIPTPGETIRQDRWDVARVPGANSDGEPLWLLKYKGRNR